MRLQIFVLVALCGWLAACCTMPPPQTASTRVMTYNIRYDNPADGANAWPKRRTKVVALLRFYAPDLFGAQEVTAGQLADLKADLPQYRFIGVGRDDGKQGGEFSPLAIRKSRYEVLGYGTFWLSPTPSIPSKGWDAMLPRIATWVQLKDRKSGAHILALNTHWDHKGETAREMSAREIRDFLQSHRKKCENLVMTGDLNAKQSASAYKALVVADPPDLLNTLDISVTPPFGPPGTFNAFDIHHQESEAIDHIFVGKGVRVLRHGVLTQQDNGLLPSDHYPVLADLALPSSNCRQ